MGHGLMRGNCSSFEGKNKVFWSPQVSPGPVRPYF